jgi:TonB family protein
MKKTLTITAAFVALALSSSALAYSPKDSAKPETAPATKLVPSKIVQPTRLPLSFTREIVTIEFSLDPMGRPQEIKVLSNADRAAKEQIVQAFKQWKFDPAVRGNGSEPKRFVLPLDIIPEV